MATLFNQTNIAPGTAFASGGGSGGSDFNTINLSTINFTAPVGGTITTYPVPGQGPGPGGVIIGTSNNTQPLTASLFAFGVGAYGIGEYQQSLWNQTGLTTQGNQTGTTYANVISFNSQIDTSANDTLSYYRVSTIGTGQPGAAGQINMVGLVSTLKSVYPSIVL